MQGQYSLHFHYVLTASEWEQSFLPILYLQIQAALIGSCGGATFTL